MKKLSLEIKKIASKNIVDAIGDFANVSVETVKMIAAYCKENELYSEIFVKLADEIRLGLDTYTIRRIAENIKEDIEKTNIKRQGSDPFPRKNNKVAA